MTGSSLIPIVVPIMAFLAMGAWLGLVFYADSHPGRRRAESEAGPGAKAAAQDTAQDGAARPEPKPLAHSGADAWIDHERIDETASGAVFR